METENISTTRQKAPHHGDNVKKVRRLRNIKQATLAELLGKSVNTLYGIEKQAVIADDTLQLIADKLGVHIDILKNMTDDCEIQINVDNNNGNVGSGFDIDIENDVNQFSHILDKLYERITAKEIEIHDLKKELKQYKKQ